MNVAFTYKLPLPLDARTTKAVLQRAHDDWTDRLQTKIAEIVGRSSSYVANNVYLHKLDSTIDDIGDCDVLAYFPADGLLLNIESKIIDPAYCFKDSRRIAEKIFGRHYQSAATKGSYLRKVETRHEYLEKNAANVIRSLGWETPKQTVTVRSLFVTQESYWWTRFPPVATEVRFVQSQLLDDFLRNPVAEPEP